MGMPANMRAGSTGRFQNPAPPRPTFRPLHRGDAVQVYDWRCPGCDTPGDRGELNDAYEIVVVRGGSFVREVNGAPAFLAGGMLTFAAPGEVHRIRHPVPGGDTCSVYRVTADSLREIGGLVEPAQRDREFPRFPLGDMPIGGRAYLLHRLAWRAADGDDPMEREETACWFAFTAMASACSRVGRPTGARGAHRGDGASPWSTPLGWRSCLPDRSTSG